MSTQNMNQFTKTAVAGSLDLVASGNNTVFTVRLNPSYAGDGMVPGEGVDLVDLGASDISGGLPIVGVRALDTTSIFGVKITNTKKNTAEAGEVIQVAGKGSVIWMNASEAIPRGSEVALVLATPGDIAIADTETVLGRTIDKASAADQLVRVLIG